MNENNLQSEIINLKEKVKELQDFVSKYQQSISSFGRSYSKVGDSNSDFLIKTKGQVKIQWGNKFIDLIKDGKINSESNILFSAKQVGKKDGIYIIQDETGNQVILQIKGTQINLLGEGGNTFISFQSKQELNSLQKYTAMSNIGLIYKDLQSVPQDSLYNGIIYIESEKKLYIISDGKVSQYEASVSNPFNEQFIIEKADNGVGALIIKGDNKENSIAFNSMYIFSKDTDSYFEFKNSLNFYTNDIQILSLYNNRIVINTKLECDFIQSLNANNKKGFRLYTDSTGSTLEIDRVVARYYSELPVGAIIMYNGLVQFIPDGWAICDGNNGTPNLVGKFIKARGEDVTEEKQKQGGSESITLTIDNLPSHTHRIESQQITTSTNGSHIHQIGSEQVLVSLGDTSITHISSENTTNTTESGEHSHTIDLSSITLESVGNNEPINIEPPYYSLIYIMKIS